MEIWEEFETIYHYTTLEGVKGILETQSLHATHYSCLNDKSELVALKPRLLKYIETLVGEEIKKLIEIPEAKEMIEKEGGVEKAIDREAGVIVDILYRVTFGDDSDLNYFDPYIVFFCGHFGAYEQQNGLLSQWRGYGQEIGCCIVFNTKKIWELLLLEEKAFKYNGSILEKVKYEDSSIDFETDYPALAASLSKFIPDLVLQELPHYGDMSHDFVLATTTHKHMAFKEESEIRIVSSPWYASDLNHMKEVAPEQFQDLTPVNLKTVHFRNNFAPYIKLLESIEEPPLPIERIIVGPHRNSDYWLSKIQNFVKGTSIEVTSSDTPLV